MMGMKVKLPFRWRVEIRRVWDDYRVESVPHSIQVIARREPRHDPDTYSRAIGYVTTKVETPGFGPVVPYHGPTGPNPAPLVGPEDDR